MLYAEDDSSIEDPEKHIEPWTLLTNCPDAIHAHIQFAEGNHGYYRLPENEIVLMKILKNICLNENSAVLSKDELVTWGV